MPLSGDIHRLVVLKLMLPICNDDAVETDISRRGFPSLAASRILKRALPFSRRKTPSLPSRLTIKSTGTCGFFDDHLIMPGAPIGGILPTNNRRTF